MEPISILVFAILAFGSLKLTLMCLLLAFITSERK